MKKSTEAETAFPDVMSIAVALNSVSPNFILTWTWWVSISPPHVLTSSLNVPHSWTSESVTNLRSELSSSVLKMWRMMLVWSSCAGRYDLTGDIRGNICLVGI